MKVVRLVALAVALLIGVGVVVMAASRRSRVLWAESRGVNRYEIVHRENALSGYWTVTLSVFRNEANVASLVLLSDSSGDASTGFDAAELSSDGNEVRVFLLWDRQRWMVPIQIPRLERKPRGYVDSGLAQKV